MTIEDVWNSPGNTPTAQATTLLVRDSFERLRRRRRRDRALLAWLAVVLPTLTAGVLYGPVQGGWTLPLILASQWGVFLYWLRQALRSSRSGLPAATIRESLETLLRETEAERRKTIAVLALYAVVVPLLGVSLMHLRDSGLMAPHEAVSAGAVFAGVLGLGLAVILARLFGSVVPRQRRLAALVAQYGTDALATE
jgi:hypothetical protein